MKILIACLFAGAVGAADITADGVLGNSGGQGPALVKGGPAGAKGLGLAVDRWGCLWDRVGKGVLLRLSADGRMLGRFVIPTEEHHYSDRLAIAGGTVVLLLRNNLYTLPVDAPNGSQAKPLKLKAEALSPTAWRDRVLIGDEQGLNWLDPATGATTPAGPGYKGLGDLEVGPDGTIYLMSEWKLRALKEGKELTDGWPRQGPGEKPQLIDGAWYGHAWHSTIKRCNLDLAPDPGVVLGGNSGSFIGHVDESPDVINGRGMVRTDGGGWAVSGHTGGVILLGWNGATRQFAVQRRIGSLPEVQTLVIDTQGRIGIGAGWWNWDDLPDTPQREALGVNSSCRFAQAAPLAGGRFAATVLQYGSHPQLVCGQPQNWRQTANKEHGIAVPKNMAAAAAIPVKQGYELVCISDDGKPFGFVLSGDGSYRAKLDQLTLSLQAPSVKSWTSLAADPQGRLLAAADGSVIVLARDGAGWKEERRWNSWGAGPAERFGQAIWIQVDGARLWVSDRDRHRVLCFDAKGGALVASFGSVDGKGDDLVHLDGPQSIAACGDRAVVHDAGNQRLIKLNIR